MNFQITHLPTILKHRRKLLKLTQADLAQMAEVSLHTIIDLEGGKGNPTLGVANRVLNILGLELALQPKQPSPSPTGTPIHLEETSS